MIQTIVEDYPPNYQVILKAFPTARRPGVIFSYGDKIFAPPGAVLPLKPALVAHEAVHGARQRDIGVEIWWDKYITDANFRYHEELLAHRAEYKAMIAGNPNRSTRRSALKIVAKRLSSELYACGNSLTQCCRDILDGAEE